MKKRACIAAMVFFAVLAASSSASSQNANEENKSNGVVEILALYLPDFVAFKPAKGATFKEYEVWLVSEQGKSFRAYKTTALRVDVDMNNGKYESTCTEESEIRAMFDIKENFFTAAKVRFVIDRKEMRYNLADGKWE